jgi:hypothetical protein
MPRGKPFVKGKPRTGGRPKGQPNHATVEARELARELLADPQYQRKFKTRLLAGRLAPALERMLWYYAHGRPREHVEIEASGELRDALASVLGVRADDLPD